MGPGRSGLTSKSTIWDPSDCPVWVIPNLKNHLMTPYWAVRNQWSTFWQWFYAPEMRKIIRNIIDTHNIQRWHLENVLSAFKVATVNRTYSPFEGPGPSIRLGPGPSKGEYDAKKKGGTRFLNKQSKKKVLLWSFSGLINFLSIPYIRRGSLPQIWQIWNFSPRLWIIPIGLTQISHNSDD